MSSQRKQAKGRKVGGKPGQFGRCCVETSLRRVRLTRRPRFTGGHKEVHLALRGGHSPSSSSRSGTPVHGTKEPLFEGPALGCGGSCCVSFSPLCKPTHWARSHFPKRKLGAQNTPRVIPCGKRWSQDLNLRCWFQAWPVIIHCMDLGQKPIFFSWAPAAWFLGNVLGKSHVGVLQGLHQVSQESLGQDEEVGTKSAGGKVFVNSTTVPQGNQLSG